MVKNGNKCNIEIVPLKSEELSEITKIHIECFPDNFSSKLGIKLLANYYKEYHRQAPELFLVQRYNGHAVGFCMGYYCSNNCANNNFLKHNLIRLSFKVLILLLKRDRLTANRVKTFFSPNSKSEHNFEDKKVMNILKSKDKAGDILSICILQKFRGNGEAVKLIKQFERVLAENKIPYCVLSCENSNKRGLRFYEKVGYKPYAKTENTTSFIKSTLDSEE